MESMETDAGGGGLAAVACVTALPALAMAGGSCAISAGEPSESLQARLQHFSAGLLIGAVVADIFPILKEHLYSHDKGSAGAQEARTLNFVAAITGVACALALMYGLKYLELEGAEDDDDDEGKSMPGGRPKDTHGGPLDSPLLDRQVSEDPGLQRTIASLAAKAEVLEQLVQEQPIDREAVDEEVHAIDFLVDSASRRCRGEGGIEVKFAQRLRSQAASLESSIEKIRRLDPLDLPAIDTQLGSIAMALRCIHTSADKARVPFRRWATSKLPDDEGDTANASATPAAVPWGLVLAVAIDAMVDGMLIGLAASVALQSGWMMSTATAIEMGFLGYSFACTIVKTGASRPLVVALLGLPPMALMAASILAAVGAARLERSPAFIGLVAFALVALLFLVVEELLREAREKAADVWHVSIWLYIGLLLTFSLDVVLG